MVKQTLCWTLKRGLGRGHSHVSIPARLTAGAAFSSSLETITYLIIGQRLLKTILFPWFSSIGGPEEERDSYRVFRKHAPVSTQSYCLFLSTRKTCH